MKIYTVDTNTPLQDGLPRVRVGASKLLGVVGPGGRAPEVKDLDAVAAVALAYNSDCFAVVPIDVHKGESVAEISPAIEQEFTLTLSGVDVAGLSGEFRFAAILDQWSSLSWPDGVDGWRSGVVDLFLHYHLGVPVPKGPVHCTFLQFVLSPAAPGFKARLPRELHRLHLVDAPFGWTVVPPWSFLPAEESLELEAIRLRLRTICLVARDGSPLPDPQSVRLGLKEERPDGSGWYSSSMLELPFQPTTRAGCVQYTLPLAHENRESSIVVILPDGNEAESEQFRGIPVHLDLVVD